MARTTGAHHLSEGIACLIVFLENCEFVSGGRRREKNRSYSRHTPTEDKAISDTCIRGLLLGR